MANSSCYLQPRKAGQIGAAVILILLAVVLSGPGFAQDIIELETTTIQGNTELPKYMYVVPWRDTKNTKAQERKLKLHNLYGELFDPLLPEPLPETELPAQQPGNPQ